jgi:hypothetical protein
MVVDKISHLHTMVDKISHHFMVDKISHHFMVDKISHHFQSFTVATMT